MGRFLISGDGTGGGKDWRMERWKKLIFLVEGEKKFIFSISDVGMRKVSIFIGFLL